MSYIAVAARKNTNDGCAQRPAALALAPVACLVRQSMKRWQCVGNALAMIN